MVKVDSVQEAEPLEAKSIAEIPGFPFESFEQLQAAVAIRSFNVGVDPLAAAEWSGRSGSRAMKAAIAVLSLLLVGAACASILAAVLTGEYWLFLAVPIQAVAFYVSQPSSGVRKWVTLSGAISLAVFINLLLNGLVIAATLLAYAALTFAAVRAASYLTNSSFRRALLSDEALFLRVYASGACTVRNNRTSRVYSA
jgi:hypothetical protein